MKTRSRILSILLTLCLSLMLLTPAFALPVSSGMSLNGQTVILYTANVRGDIDVYPKMAAIKAGVESYGLNAILVDAGNFLQGSVYAAADCGNTVVSLMEKAGYAVAALGAHEFDWNNSSTGTERHGDFVQHRTLPDLAASSTVALISSTTMKGSDYAFAPSAVLTAKSGLKVGFVANTAVEPGRVFPNDCAIFNTLTFNRTAALDAAKAALQADTVITLSNSGTLSGSAVIDIPAGDTPAAGYVVLSKSGTVLMKDTIDLSAILADEALAAEVAAVKLANENAQYARSTVTLSGQNQAACKGETNLGDFWCDALRWFALEGGIGSYYDPDELVAGNTGIAVDADHVVALWNGGNLKADLRPGTVTDTELKAVLPYPNKVAVVYMTGAQLTEALEAAAQGLPYSAATASACNAFMQVSGLTYTVDAYKSFDKGEAYGSAWFTAQSVRRVSITSVNGRAYDPAATYAVITSNANFNGMDSSYVFKAAQQADSRSTITTIAVRDAVWMYVKQALGGTIGQHYAEAQGRITVNGYPFADVTPDDSFSEAVWYVNSKGLMVGTAEGTFAPEATATRAQAVTVLWRMAGCPVVNYAMKFSDVSEDKWYTEAIRWAASEGIAVGYGNGQFGTHDAVTLKHFALMLSRYTGLSLSESSNSPATRAQMAALVMDRAQMAALVMDRAG